MFRAYEPDEDRLVAVKVFRLDVPPERVHQLVAELDRLIASDLTHPGIAVPLAAGITGTSAYLAQDFVAADSLDTLLRERGRSPAPEVFRVATELAGALDFAAALDVTHGALHPRDVLVSPDETRLTGLGIARALERIGGGAAVRRPYTAPERAAGSSWDRRADIFSLAALAYEMLTGKRVPAAGDRAGDAITEVSGGDVAALRRIFARALAEDPADRFETALGFADALKDAISIGRQRPAVRRPVEEHPVARTSRLSSADRRPPAEEELLLPLEPELSQPLALHEAPSPELLLSGLPDIPRPPAAPEQIPIEFREAPFEPDRSAIWPLILAVVVGLAVGFAGGFGVASRDQSAQTSPTDPEALVTSATLAPGASSVGPSATRTREFTDAAVSAPPKADAAGGVPLKAAPTDTLRPSATSASGRLLVRSTPSGATVWIDGTGRGRTPTTVRDLDRGAHTVRVARDGYTAVERRVTISAARPAQSVTIELARASVAVPSAAGRVTPATSGRSTVSTGGLFVDSRPSGASVFVDEKLIGTTPLLLDTLDAGEHAVRLGRDGYRRWTSAVRIVAGERNRVTASLER